MISQYKTLFSLNIFQIEYSIFQVDEILEKELKELSDII